MNIDGNYTNFDSFSVELDRYEHKFSVIGIAETNVDKCNGCLYQLSGYTACFQDKKPGKFKGSGVALYIHNDFNFVFEEKLSCRTDNLESVIVRITNTSEELLVGSIYRPPSGSIQEFHKEIESILTEASKFKSYLMGDFNTDLFKNNSETRDFEDIIYSNGFGPLISVETHHKVGSTSALIDNIICTCNNVSHVQ